MRINKRTDPLITDSALCLPICLARSSHLVPVNSSESHKLAAIGLRSAINNNNGSFLAFVRRRGARRGAPCPGFVFVPFGSSPTRHRPSPRMQIGRWQRVILRHRSNRATMKRIAQCTSPARSVPWKVTQNFAAVPRWNLGHVGGLRFQLR